MNLPKRQKPQIPSRESVSEERTRLQRRKKYFQTLGSTVGILLVVAALAVLISTMFLPVLKVAGTSMEPTLSDGDTILLFKGNGFSTGDLVGLHYDGKVLLKRVIGTPGDFVDIDENGNVSVNGEYLEEPYISEKALGECDITFPYQVPENSYFVLGDHRSVSIDSRSSVIGCIKKDQIIGKVMVKIWPLSDFSFI